MPSGRKGRPAATCHPDRPHLAKGLCASCYGVSRARIRIQQGKISFQRIRNWKHDGIDVNSAITMIEKCQGICRICKASGAKHLDHDHKTKRVRGVLCQRCNQALGLFKDNPQNLVRAVYYLALEEEKRKWEKSKDSPLSIAGMV